MGVWAAIFDASAGRDPGYTAGAGGQQAQVPPQEGLPRRLVPLEAVAQVPLDSQDLGGASSRCNPDAYAPFEDDDDGSR